MNQPRPLPDVRVKLRQRIGDAERNVAAEQLSTHFAAGRITNEEFDQRLGQVMSARTTEDLWRQLSDLPAIRLAPKTTEIMATPERKWGAIDTLSVIAIFGSMFVGTLALVSMAPGVALGAFIVGLCGAIAGAAFAWVISRHHQRAVDRRSRQLRGLGQQSPRQLH